MPMFWNVSGRGRHVAGHPDVVVDDLGVDERVGSTGSIEHADGQVEIKVADVGERPVLIVAAIEEEHAFQVDRGQVARSLDRGIAQIGGGERDVVQVSRGQDAVVVGVACDVVAAGGPARAAFGSVQLKVPSRVIVWPLEAAWTALLMRV